MTKLEEMLNELILHSYRSALNVEGAAGRANEIKAKIMEQWAITSKVGSMKMTTEEFRALVTDRLDNACHDPMGKQSAIDEIVGTYERDVERAFQNGVHAGQESVGR